MKNKPANVDLLQQTLDQIAYNYKGYKVEQIAKSFLNYIVIKDFKFPKSFYSEVFYSMTFAKFPKGKCSTFLTFPAEYDFRKEYKEIWEHVSSKINDKLTYSISYPHKYKFSFRNCLLALKLVRPLRDLGFSKKFQIWVSLVMVLKAIDSAEKELQILPAKYVCFYSAHWIENLLTQYFKKREVKTYNLQHGMFTFTSPDARDEKTRLNNLLNNEILSDYQLAWGELTRNTLRTITASQILVAGYPGAVDASTFKLPQTRKCLVCLSRPLFNAENKDLLSILFAFNKSQNEPFSFLIKLHPSLNMQEYQNHINQNEAAAHCSIHTGKASIRELIHKENIDFCISANTTAYYECYLNGLIALRYHASSFNEFYDIAHDAFSDQEKLESLIAEIYSQSSGFKSSEIRRRLNYAIGCDEDRYAEILN